MLLSLSAVVGLASVVSAAAVHDGTHQMDSRHKAHANRAVFNATAKRADQYHGQATYFEVGMGACGQMSKDSDWLVALNTAQWGGDGYPGPNCFKTITISANGKTASCQILDQCPTCDYGSLDMSPSLFQHFSSLDAGVFPITWWYGNGDGGGGDQETTTSKKPDPPKTTSTHTTPTSTADPTTSSTSAATSTSASTSSSNTITGTTSSASGTSTSTASVANGKTGGQPQGGNIYRYQMVVANMGQMAATGRGGQAS